MIARVPAKRVLGFHSFAVVARLCCALVLPCAIGCSEQEGEECQVPSDCASGLVCDRARSAARGVCRTHLTVPDASTGQPDASLPEEDAGSSNEEDGGAAPSAGDAG